MLASAQVQINSVESQRIYTVDQFAGTSHLPTLPEVALKLIELAQEDDPDFAEVSRTICADPVISGKVMTTVNSALLGFRPKVETVRDAVNKLGINMIRTLLLSFHLANQHNGPPELEATFQKHWRSSLTQAVLAELIAERMELEPAAYFLAAMLQDVGILAMLVEAPDTYTQHVLLRAKFPTVVSAERSHFGFSHIAVSAAIAAKWGLPDRFQDSIRHHHDHITNLAVDQRDSLGTVSRAASLGAAVVLAKPNADSLLDPVGGWSDFLRQQVNLSAEVADEIISEVIPRVNEYSALFNFNIGEGVKAEQVVVQAKDMLQEIALANQLELISDRRLNTKSKAAESERYLDELTGLHNRRYMNEHLQPTLELAVRKRYPIAMLFLDIDKFKQINDTYGHTAGDQAICHVADWLNSSIRKGDFAIRMGGDEFVVVLSGINKTNFTQAGKRIAEQTPQLVIDGETIKISLSVGGIYYKPKKGDAVDPNWLIDEADQAMYAAKKTGGGCLSFQTFEGRA